MTEEEILNIAGEIWNSGSSFPIPSSDDILRFAQIVVGIEREACAKIADVGADGEDPYCCLPVATSIAKDIRARGQHD